MNCPYDEITLRIALLSANGKLVKISEEKGDVELMRLMDTAVKEMGEGPSDKETLNKEVAAHNGVSVSDLIGSPNYQELVQEFCYSRVVKVIDNVKDLFGFTSQEAWAVILAEQLR